MEIKVTIEFKEKGKNKIVLTEIEAKELYRKLDEIYGTKWHYTYGGTYTVNPVYYSATTCTTKTPTQESITITC